MLHKFSMMANFFLFAVSNVIQAQGLLGIYLSQTSLCENQRCWGDVRHTSVQNESRGMLMNKMGPCAQLLSGAFGLKIAIMIKWRCCGCCWSAASTTTMVWKQNVQYERSRLMFANHLLPVFRQHNAFISIDPIIRFV